MKKYRSIFTTIIIILILFTIRMPVSWAEEKPVQSTELKSTVITPYLPQNITPGKNLVFCSTFQLAWNQLTGKILKGDLLLKDAPVMAGILNKMRQIITGKDLSEKSYLAMAGYGKDNIVNNINAAMKKKFGDEAWLVDEQLSPTDILAFAFLVKNLSFTTQFDDAPNGIAFGEKDKVQVKAFGIPKFAPIGKMKELFKQVDIPYYDAKNEEFAVKLRTDSFDDELVLACIKPGKTMEETYKRAKDMAGKRGKRLDDGDVLLIPEIDFFIEHSYKELLNKYFLNKGFTRYFIAKALQVTKFKLDKTGAKLKSKAVIVAKMNGGGGKYRKMIFNKPFMLYMKERKASNPYFVMWIDNAELLVKK